MIHETTASMEAPAASPPFPGRDEHATLTNYLRRASWTLAVLIVGLVGSLLAVRSVRVRAAEQEQRNVTIARLALTTELAATNRESALRLHLVIGDSSALTRAALAKTQLTDALRSLSVITADDDAAMKRVATLNAAIARWEREFAAPIPAGGPLPRGDELRGTIAHGSALFGIVREQLEQLVSLADAEHEEGARSLRRVERQSLLALLAAFSVLALIVYQLMRRLRTQAGSAVRSHGMIERQNAELHEQRDALETQAVQLQEQAAELEVQQSDLQNQTVELESALDDLREVEQRERELAENATHLNRRLSEAQRVAQLGYWEIDSATGHVFWSDEMYRLCGAPPGLLPPPTEYYLECVHPQDRDRLAQVAKDALEKLTEFTEQYRLRVPDGLMRTVLAKGRVVDDDQRRRKLIGTVQDITDRVQLENQLRHSQKMEAVGTLAGGVAHDFNNMLTVILGYTSILRSELAGKDLAREELDEISRAAERAAELTRQLLTFSRQHVSEARQLQPNDVVAGVERMLRRLIPESIELRVQLDPDAAIIEIDPGQLEQVLVNLAVNARDAMPDGGELTIETANVTADEGATMLPADLQGDRFVMLTVRDSGKGMDDFVRARIFEPFFTTKEVGQGSGLGLAIVYGIVEQAGGHIAVNSEVGRGTTIHVLLPAVPDAGAEAASLTLPPRMQRGTETVLLVEDEPGVRVATRLILQQAGYTVIEAPDGPVALDLFRARADEIDLVVTDMVMPGMNGRELADHLRAIRAGVRVLFTSGYTDDAVFRRGLLDRGGLFIQKPYTLEAFCARVREALQAGAPA